MFQINVHSVAVGPGGQPAHALALALREEAFEGIGSAEELGKSGAGIAMVRILERTRSTSAHVEAENKQK